MKFYVSQMALFPFLFVHPRNYFITHIWNHRKMFYVLTSLWFYVGHPWVQDDGMAPDKPLDPAVLSRLTQFSAMNKLKKMAFRVSVIYFASR